MLFVLNGDEANRLAREGVLIGSDSVNNYLSLEGGNILLNPEKDMIVGTSQGKISVKAGASIFISQHGEDVVIYDLLQTKPNQVSMVTAANKHKVVLEPGHMLVLTPRNIDNFDNLPIDCHRVECSHKMHLDIHSTVQGFMANFSIASAMSKIEPLKESIASGNKQDELITTKLVRGAVVLGESDVSNTDINTNVDHQNEDNGAVRANAEPSTTHTAVAFVKADSTQSANQ